MSNRNIIKGKAGNALTSAAEDHIIAVSGDVFDENKQEYQEHLNSRFDASLASIAANYTTHEETEANEEVTARALSNLNGNLPDTYSEWLATGLAFTVAIDANNTGINIPVEVIVDGSDLNAQFFTLVGKILLTGDMKTITSAYFYLDGINPFVTATAKIEGGVLYISLQLSTKIMAKVSATTYDSLTNVVTSVSDAYTKYNEYTIIPVARFDSSTLVGTNDINIVGTFTAGEVHDSMFSTDASLVEYCFQD